MENKNNLIINNDNKCIYSYYLVSLLFSPFFTYLPFIFGIFLFICLKYLEPGYLCDGESIEDLKNKLIKEVVKYNEVMIDYNNFINQTILAEKVDENLIQSDLFNEVAESKLDEAVDIISKIRNIEISIKEKEPDFKSLIKKQDFEDED